MKRLAAVLCAGVVLASSPALGNSRSDALRIRAADEFYNLDREQALASYREAVAADPDDAAAERGLASTLWLSITFRRGNMTVDDYLGRPTRQKARFPPPPAETVAAFNAGLDRALARSRTRLAANPKDVDAQYELGAAVGLRASYMATVENSILPAFRAAREAYEAHETVLRLAPARRDAGLVVGTYRYVVATLSLPLRLMAYAAGFGGGKDMGLHLIEDAAAYPGSSQTDARLALILLYNRDRRFDDALRVIADLRARYPRNRLLTLEAGSTSLRAGRTAEAEAILDDGIRALAADSRARMYGEDALWYEKRGAVRTLLGRTSDARADLTRAVAAEGRDWVHGRAHLDLGQLAIAAGDQAEAARELGLAAALCEGDNDPRSARRARELLMSLRLRKP